MPPSGNKSNADSSGSSLIGAVWLRSFRPARTRVDSRERWRIVLGAFIGVLLTGALSHWGMGVSTASLPWLVAPLGASAVLVFAMPASPLAQPWSVVGGNTLSALIGIACARWVAPPELAAALAVGLAIGIMLALRCLHPPGGASALLMVLGGITNPWFALFPVLLNSLLLALAGIGYNNVTRRRYPHAQQAVAQAGSGATRAADTDLDEALARYNQVLDISRDDLQTLLAETQLRAYERKLTDLRCEDIMSRQLVTVEFGTPLQEAWALLRERGIKALPVVDRSMRIAGIITLADFLRAAELDLHEGFDEKLRKLIRNTRRSHSSKPEVVGQIMTRNVRVASMQRHLVDLVPLFGSTGHHHLPIIGPGERLVGMITQSDLVQALGRAVDPAQ